MEIDKKPFLEEIVNKQFQNIGVAFRLKDMPEDGFVEEKGKKVLWWNLYKFETEEQYQEWRSWALRKLSSLYDNPEYEFGKLDLCYGMSYRYHKGNEKKKEKQLGLF